MQLNQDLIAREAVRKLCQMQDFERYLRICRYRMVTDRCNEQLREIYG